MFAELAITPPRIRSEGAPCSLTRGDPEYETA
jgi:hypothetical protein